MIKYQPPKSQVWGHQVGRKTAAQIVERGLMFLHEQCASANPTPAELMIGWTPAKHSSVAQAVEAIRGQLGAATKVVEVLDDDELVFRQLRWPVSVSQLPAVARWFDGMHKPLSRGEVVAMCSTYWTFVWRKEATAAKSAEECGGMFGIHLHLCRQHRITTMFRFQDAAHYVAIREYLRAIELVELSDKHVRPKGAIPTAGRRGS